MITIKLTEEQVVMLEMTLKDNMECIAQNLTGSYVHEDDMIHSADEIKAIAEILKQLKKKGK